MIDLWRSKFQETLDCELIKFRCNQVSAHLLGSSNGQAPRELSSRNTRGKSRILQFSSTYQSNDSFDTIQVFKKKTEVSELYALVFDKKFIVDPFNS